MYSPPDMDLLKMHASQTGSNRDQTRQSLRPSPPPPISNSKRTFLFTSFSQSLMSQPHIAAGALINSLPATDVLTMHTPQTRSNTSVNSHLSTLPIPSIKLIGSHTSFSTHPIPCLSLLQLDQYAAQLRGVVLASWAVRHKSHPSAHDASAA